MQIVQQLRPMLINQCCNRFEFENDFPIADEVWVVCLDESPITVAQGQRGFEIAGRR